VSRTAARRRIRLAEIVLLAVTVAGLTFLTDAIVSGGIFSSGRDVEVELASAGGLYPGSNVTYRGSRTGTVRAVDLRPGGGVVARVRLDGDVRVPADTEAVVTNLSPIGEQYLDLRPRTSTGPFLADGDVIAEANTDVPPRFDAVLRHVTELAELVDPDDVDTITTEIGAAVDTRTDLLEVARLADSGLTTLSDLYPRWTALARQARTPLRTVVDHGDDLQSFTTEVEKLTAELADRDDTIDGLITSAGAAVPAVEDLVAAIDPLLKPLLADTRAIAAEADARPEGLAHWLRWAPRQMIGMAESTRDGSGWVVLVPNTSPTCDYGTPNASPRSVERHAASLDARCTVKDPVVQQRGSQYAPRP
jgi:phospholipid/cholesterol/gamma-HCH transport system substrate-binding protein